MQWLPLFAFILLFQPGCDPAIKIIDPTPSVAPTSGLEPTSSLTPTPATAPSPSPGPTPSPTPTPSPVIVDADADGFADTEDCDDGNAAINPSAMEVCEEGNIDEDCNGVANDEDLGTDPSSQVTYYPDSDGDGFGDPFQGMLQCDGTEFPPTDCDDDDANVYPGASESCNGKDNDCNKQIPTCWGTGEWSVSSWLWTLIPE